MSKLVEIPIPAEFNCNENRFVHTLIERHQEFMRNQASQELNYDLFPSRTGENYNSNSYIAGLLNFGGIDLKSHLRSLANVQDPNYGDPGPNAWPGANKPVPNTHFE